MMMSGRIAAALVAATLIAGACSQPEPATDRANANVLLVTIDTLRADRLGSWGYGPGNNGHGSPALDRLATGGVRFESAHATVPTTDPSHASILTGLYPRSHGLLVNASRAVDDLPTLADWMRAQGKTTAAITARLGLDPPRRNLSGFDSSDSPQREQHWRNSGEIVELTRKWLANNGDGPWFLWVHLWEPHKPYEPPSTLRRGTMARHDQLPRRFSDPPRFLRSAVLPGRQVETARGLYDGEVSHVDSALGAIVKLARQSSPRGEAPLIVVASDHGESLAERQQETGIGFGHGTLLYEETLHVPLIMQWQGKLAPRVITTPMSLVDLAPTVAGLLNPTRPFTAQGRDLSAWLSVEAQPPVAPFYAQRRPFRSPPLKRLAGSEEAWFETPWKLILAEQRPPELYRLDLDPGERSNRADQQPVRLARMSAALEAWKQANPPARSRKDGGEADISPSERAALKALGYLD
ncbi:MAG: sulfatase [bacterium]